MKNLQQLFYLITEQLTDIITKLLVVTTVAKGTQWSELAYFNEGFK